MAVVVVVVVIVFLVAMMCMSASEDTKNNELWNEIEEGEDDGN